MKATILSLLLLALGVFVAFPGLAGAQTTLDGPWTMTLTSPEGTNTIPLTLAQEGEAVTASIRSGEPEAPVLFAGTLTGTNVHFFWALDYQGMALEITMTGELKEGILAGIASFSGLAQGDWEMRRTE